MSGWRLHVPVAPIDPSRPTAPESLLQPLATLLSEKALACVGRRVPGLGFADYLLDFEPGGTRDGVAWNNDALSVSLSNPGGFCALYLEAVGHWMEQIVVACAMAPPACFVAANLRPTGVRTAAEVRASARPIVALARKHWFVQNPADPWAAWILVNNESQAQLAALSTAQQQNVFAQTRDEVIVRGLSLDTRKESSTGRTLFGIWRGARIWRLQELFTCGPAFQSVRYADLGEEERLDLLAQLARVRCNCIACQGQGIG
jgi:hypothetical protein